MQIRYDNKNGRVRARATVELLDGEKIRLEAYGGMKAAAKLALEDKIKTLNQKIKYGEERNNGELTLASAVEQKLRERQEEFDRNRKRSKRRDSTCTRDLVKYRKELEIAKYDASRVVWA